MDMSSSHSLLVRAINIPQKHFSTIEENVLRKLLLQNQLARFFSYNKNRVAVLGNKAATSKNLTTTSYFKKKGHLDT